MPIYEYRCEECGQLFEQMQKITDAPLNRCILCGGKAHRIISKSTFILKGTGWYVTDYPSKDRLRDTNTDKTHASTSTNSTDTPSTPAEPTATSSAQPSASSSAVADTTAASVKKKKKSKRPDKSRVAA
ncbi:zinc ribbon domain-containing protein [bacterium]|nr:zinc ribbon domain-containing protein [bacterium]